MRLVQDGSQIETCSHFPHDFWSSYENLIHYQSDDSHAH